MQRQIIVDESVRHFSRQLSAFSFLYCISRIFTRQIILIWILWIFVHNEDISSTLYIIISVRNVWQIEWEWKYDDNLTNFENSFEWNWNLIDFPDWGILNFNHIEISIVFEFIIFGVFPDNSDNSVRCSLILADICFASSLLSTDSVIFTKPFSAALAYDNIMGARIIILNRRGSVATSAQHD